MFKRLVMVPLLIIPALDGRAEEMSDADRRAQAEWRTRQAAFEEAQLAPLRARAALKDWYAVHPEITPAVSEPMASLDLRAALSYVRETEEDCDATAEQQARSVVGAFEMRKARLATYEQCTAQKLPATFQMRRVAR